MPVPSSISDLSTTPSLNSPAGTESPSTVDDYLRTQAAFIKQVDNKATGAVKATDLAAPGGSALVGYDGGTVQDVLDDAKPMASYTALRAYTGRATGVRITQQGIAGFFQRDDADTTSADNGGTIIVDAIGRRWRRDCSECVYVGWFGAAEDGFTDDSQPIQAAIDWLASLDGPAHASSNPKAHNYPYGVSRVLRMSGRKCGVSSGIVLKNSVSLDAQGGGFKALAGFPDGESVLRTDGQYFGGSVNNLVIDGSALNVKGIEAWECFNTRWRNIEVVNCKNDGVSVYSGSEFFLDAFKIACADLPQTSAKGLYITTSDCHFLNGAVQFYPFGVWGQGGGNNEFTNVHAWGLYAGQKMRVCFVLNGSARNTFVACYADSPTRADYGLNPEAPLAGYINGGFGWWIDNNSDGNSLIGCRAFINGAEYTAAGLPAGQTLYPLGITSTSEDNRIFDFRVGYSEHWYATPYWGSFGAEISTYMLGYTNYRDWSPKSSESTASQAASSFVKRVSFQGAKSGAVNVSLASATHFSIGKAGDLTLTFTDVPSNRFAEAYVEVTLFVYGDKTSMLTILGASIPTGKSLTPAASYGQQFIRMFTVNGGANWFITDIEEY